MIWAEEAHRKRHWRLLEEVAEVEDVVGGGCRRRKWWVEDVGG
jgi:hypothetical protein